MATQLEKEKADRVIKDVSGTKTLTLALKENKIDSQAFFEALKEVPLLASKYADAQAARAELLVDEIIDIADNEDDAQKARNRIDVRKWAASKMKPEKFGDRIDVNIKGTPDIKSALEEARNRIRQVIEITTTQVLESTATKNQDATGLQPAETGSTENFDLDDLFK